MHEPIVLTFEGNIRGGEKICGVWNAKDGEIMI
jgi:hypothetical protein